MLDMVMEFPTHNCYQTVIQKLHDFRRDIDNSWRHITGYDYLLAFNFL